MTTFPPRPSSAAFRRTRDKDFFSITLQAGELLVLDVDVNPPTGSIPS